MSYKEKIRRGILLEFVMLFACVSVLLIKSGRESEEILHEAEQDKMQEQSIEVSANGDYIKWVDFDVCYEALCCAYEWDIKTHEEKRELNWIELLAYAGTRTGGKVDKSACKYINSLAKDIVNGETTMAETVENLEYYPYYYEAYTAVLGGLVGEYEAQKTDENGKLIWEKCYGLKGFSPVAKGFYYEDYDDFGADRSYGYKRPHLGHDMMGQTGTPI